MQWNSRTLVGLLALLAACEGSGGDGGSGGGGGGGGGGGEAAVLDVSVEGAGAVDVTGGGVLVHCQGQCTIDVPAGEPLVAIARPNVGAVFTGWGGVCTGQGDCAVTPSGTVTLTATFAPAPPPPPGQRALSVQRIGEGAGRVTSAPAGIDCGATCRANYAQGTTVTLAVTPAQGSRFEGWGGACAGTGACVVTLAGDVTVTARFEPMPPARSTLTVHRSGDGAGVVRSAPAGIDCGATCSAQFDAGTAVTLTADPDDGSLFQGWSGGGCSGTGECTLSLAASVAVTATFVTEPPPPPTITVALAGDGAGVVTSAPEGIDCGPTCEAAFEAGAELTLTATPAEGSAFEGWSGGGCAGTEPCTLTADADVTVTATFAPAPAPPPFVLEELAPPDEDGQVVARALNADGAVAGSYFRDGAPGPRAFLREAGQASLTFLGAPDHLTEAVDVNDAGTVAVADASERASYRWAAGELTRVEVPGGSEPAAISPAGVVVGWTSTDDGTIRAYAAADAGAVLLDPLGAAQACLATGVNGAGVVVGTCAGTAVRWDGAAVAALPVEPRSAAADVSDAGIACGVAGQELKDGDAFLLDLATGAVTYAPPPADHLNATWEAVNGAGLAVGTTLHRDGAGHAAVWLDGRLRLLAELVADPGWRLERAVGVNDAGEILVTGRDARGRVRSAVLRPRG